VNAVEKIKYFTLLGMKPPAIKLLARTMPSELSRLNIKMVKEKKTKIVNAIYQKN
jgi:hypothetical protein